MCILRRVRRAQFATCVQYIMRSVCECVCVLLCDTRHRYALVRAAAAATHNSRVEEGVVLGVFLQHGKFKLFRECQQRRRRHSGARRAVQERQRIGVEDAEPQVHVWLQQAQRPDKIVVRRLVLSDVRRVELEKALPDRGSLDQERDELLVRRSGEARGEQLRLGVMRERALRARRQWRQQSRMYWVARVCCVGVCVCVCTCAAPSTERPRS